MGMTASTGQDIEATIVLSITHRSGPVVADADHVRAWLVADGAWIEGAHAGFTYEVCPTHADPEECECRGEVAIYIAMIVGVEAS